MKDEFLCRSNMLGFCNYYEKDITSDDCSNCERSNYCYYCLWNDENWRKNCGKRLKEYCFNCSRGQERKKEYEKFKYKKIIYRSPSYTSPASFWVSVTCPHCGHEQEELDLTECYTTYSIICEGCGKEYGMRFEGIPY